MYVVLIQITTTLQEQFLWSQKDSLGTQKENKKFKAYTYQTPRIKTNHHTVELFSEPKFFELCSTVLNLHAFTGQFAYV